MKNDTFLDEAFKTDVQVGLSLNKKKISPKYFYDDRGSELFNQITRHPDYYLTQCELEILNRYKKSLAELLNYEEINLIELGPGEGIKSKLLLEEFLSAKMEITYTPIDISLKYLEKPLEKLSASLPKLKIKPINSDYFNTTAWLNVTSRQRNLVLFLGSSIGNFDHAETQAFLKHLRHVLNPGDLVLIGFDLLKDIKTLIRAYDDSDGITRKLNFNLLRRINEELHADFNIDKFCHYNTFNVDNHAMESYLVSLEPQKVTVGALDQSFNFSSFEAIHVESSHKYHLAQIEHYAATSGFKVIQHFLDSRKYFADSLWEVAGVPA